MLLAHTYYYMPLHMYKHLLNICIYIYMSIYIYIYGYIHVFHLHIYKYQVFGYCFTASTVQWQMLACVYLERYVLERVTLESYMVNPVTSLCLAYDIITTCL